MRRALAVLLLATLAALGAGLAGCGGRFALPTELRILGGAGDSTYVMQATWTGMRDIQDILLTQGSGTQLFLLFNHDPGHLRTDTLSRGEVLAYARMKPGGPQLPLPGITFNGLFSPWALCVGGDGMGAAVNRIFVLDQGDTNLTRQQPPGDTISPARWPRRITHPGLYWHLREYGLLGGDAISAFSDTSMAFVNGVAADAQGRVYVSGAVIAWVRDPQVAVYTRSFLWRVNRYARGPKHPGIPDPYVIDGDWHRDTTWMVGEGSGIGTVADPRGIYWGGAGGGALYTADLAKNWVQKLSDQVPSTGYFMIDGKTTPDQLALADPVDVVGDEQGFIYIADPGNQRVLRYDAAGNYIQSVNVDKDASGRLLVQFVNPVTVAADDSLVFVGDPGLGEVIRYKRRK
jgi:hypothetical protein